MTPEGPSVEGVEVEWQLDALDLRPVERGLAEAPCLRAGGGEGPGEGLVSVRPRPSQRLVDSYVDTADWRVGRSGFSLRIRQRGRAGEVPFQDMAPRPPPGRPH